jgi:ankyrin repeat protein
LANHADPNSQDWVGMTPLHRAAEYCGKEIALILIEKGANINALNDYSKTPLFVAAEKNNLEVAKLLIQYKASVDAIDNSNLTPLFLAESAGFDDMANLLIQNGAHPKFNEKIEKNLFASVIKRNYLSNLDYSRVEVAVDARRRLMKLWFSTAIGPQQSRCSEIGSPER